MRLLAARWVGVVILAAALLIGTGAGGGIQPASAATSGVGNVTAGNLTMEIAIQEDGDAEWTVTAEYEISSSSESAAFDRLASEFRAGETEALSVTPFEEAASQAAAVTGRSMEIRDVAREVERADDTGVLILQFRWTEFAVTRDNRLVMGDAFQSHDGTWLPRLEPSQEVVVTFPEQYVIVDSSQPLRNGTFRIEGPAEFAPGEPAAVLEFTGDGGTPPPTPGTPTNGNITTTGGTPVQGADVPLSVSLGLLAVIIGVIAYLFVRRGPGVPDGEAPVSSGGGDGDGPGSPPADVTEPAAGGDPLLADEERVLRLLEANGGRMKQVAIVEETDWSNAKVSQLLSEMDDRGEIDKLRIGRENLISLPGESPRDPK